MTDPSVAMAMLVQLFYISLAYTGFNASIYIAGDLEPSDALRETVARSMIIASLAVTGIYLGLNYLFLYCAEPSVITGGFDYFVSDVANNVGGPGLRWIMRITIALSSATSVLAMLATGPRVYVRMAQDGYLPRWLGEHGGVPRAAIIVQSLLSGAIVWLATVRGLIGYLGLTLTLCGALATCTLWIARKELATEKPIRWYEHLALGIYLAGALALGIASWSANPIQFWCCVATFASGILVFAVSRSFFAEWKQR
jgi:APA family basic amino acid/polyamine antiporter